MYRYSVDNAITYSSEDLVLFKESPFASFMERLTLENPSHGIPADIDSSAPLDSVLRQDDIADTLRLEGRNVALVDWDAPEQQRRADTLAAMRKGVDFVVNGQLALGPLSGSANLLMRTSGFSELGDFLFVPCSTQEKTTLQAAFRLCFLADLLHSLQGQLPPQMLIIRGGSNVVPLQTEDHIFHFRAVKQRFMNAQREFRKHRMPDPAESSHFGRWSDCANELLKQRALAGDSEALPPVLESEERTLPVAQAANAGGAPTSISDVNPQEQVDPVVQSEMATPPQGFSAEAGRRFNKGITVSGTLADQAQGMSSAMPAPTSGLPRTESLEPTVTVSSVEPGLTAAARDSALLTDLQFIGKASDFGRNPPGGVERRQPRSRTAPESRLGVDEPAADNAKAKTSGVALGAEEEAHSVSAPPVMTERPDSAPSPTLHGASDWDVARTDRAFAETSRPESTVAKSPSESESQEAAPHPLDSGEFNINHRSLVDRDDAPIPSKIAAPPPALGPQRGVLEASAFGDVEDELLLDARQSRDPKDPRERREQREPRESKLRREPSAGWDDEDPLAVRPFSSHLITNRDPED
ncbi:MAG: hypothetical protein ABJ013_05575 [Halioglobus sp.]